MFRYIYIYIGTIRIGAAAGAGCTYRTGYQKFDMYIPPAASSMSRADWYPDLELYREWSYWTWITQTLNLWVCELSYPSTRDGMRISTIWTKLGTGKMIASCFELLLSQGLKCWHQCLRPALELWRFEQTTSCRPQPLQPVRIKPDRKR